MKRIAAIVGLTLAVGITLGMLGDQLLNAQQQSVKRTELLRTVLGEMEGKEGIVYVLDLAPGADAGKHTHPGDEFAYILDGSMTLERQGEAPKTYKSGEAFYNPPNIVHDAKNASTTAPSRVLVFLVTEKGQPLSRPAQ